MLSYPAIPNWLIPLYTLLKSRSQLKKTFVFTAQIKCILNKFHSRRKHKDSSLSKIAL